LFQPFTQEIRDDVDLTRGTGLGLAISKKLADLMHSTLTINSKLNYGTTVTIHGIFDCIPYEKYDTGALKHLPREHSRLAGTRILICEDHPLNQEIVRILLSKQKIDVDIAENGKLGVEMFEKSREGYYQAILMDIRMPVMDGYIATRSIRNLNRRDATRIPILAMSADVFTDDIKKCLSNGMNGHIAKPIDPETMYNVIEECMGQNMKNAQ
jgi:CheY-like chemotaxis protein